MKKLLFAICAVAALASCSKEEVVSYDKGEAIGFANPFVNKATRAASAVDPSYSGGVNALESFNVWGTANGVAIYTNDPVDVSAGVGTPATTNYWVEDVSYYFAALANASDVTVTGGLPTAVKNFTAPATADKDLIYAKTSEIKGKASGENSNVPLTFTHLLSKVKFTVDNTPADNYFYKVTNIKVNGKATGDVDLTALTAAWTGKDDSETDYVVDDIVIEDNTLTAYCAQELLLIPGNFTISFTVETYFGSILPANLVKSKNYSYTNQTLATGTAYNFTIEITPGDVIKFAPSVDDWGTPVDLPM